MLAGGWSTLLSSQGHRALEGESEDGSCNGSKFLLLLAAGLGCRSRLGAVSANGHQTLSSLAGLQPTHNSKVRQGT